MKLGHRQGVDMTKYIVNDTGNPRKRDIDSNKSLSFSNFNNSVLLYFVSKQGMLVSIKKEYSSKK